MNLPERAAMLAEARTLMAQALAFLDRAEAWEAGAHLDSAIRSLDEAREAEAAGDAEAG